MSERSDEKEQQPSDDGAPRNDNNDQQQKDMINIIVKTSKERETFQVASDASIRILRDLVSERYKVEPHKVCLIFSGKILKDGDTLENHKMKDGYIVHLVIRDVSKSPSSSSSSNSASASTTAGTSTNTTSSNQSSNTSSTAGTNPTPGSGLFSNFGMFMNPGAGGNLESLNQQLAQQFNNPEFIREMLNNPFMQNLYSNPDIFRSIISNNPHLQQLIERNPELNHVLSNPEIMRQTFDMMRNPAAFQELMRSHDRALSNLESLPGGYNALRRMYTELQEPMLNAAQEQFGVNPFASNSNTTNVSTTPSNTENREPLPNPWQRSDNSAGSTGSTTNTTSSGAAGTNGSTNATNRNATFNNLFGTIMQQMNENPNMLQDLVNSPLMQNMMRLFGGSQPQTQQQQQPLNSNRNHVQSIINSMSQNMQNPLFQRIIANPQALQAFLEVQQGYEQLERILGVNTSTLHELFTNISTTTSSTSSVPVTSASSGDTSSTTNTSSTTSVTSNTTNTTASTTVPNSGTGVGANANLNMLSQMMQQMLSVPPEQRYQAQLSQLEAMGFTNREANLRALLETFGNVEAAIDLLLSRL